MNSIIIAIDGPAASGKSTVARRLAELYDLIYVNSGAIYRAVTWAILQRGICPSDENAIIAALPDVQLTCGEKNRCATIEVDGIDPGQEIVSEEVNAMVSQISKIPEVRERLLAEQRRYADLGSIVVEGRDIGTVVFPHTPYKFFLSASEEIRAKRRLEQGITDDVAARDRQDSQRKVAPLRAAADADLIDTSDLSIDGVVELISSKLATAGIKLPTI